MVGKRDDSPKGDGTYHGRAGSHPGAKHGKEKPNTNKPNDSGRGRGNPIPPDMDGSKGKGGGNSN